MLKLTNYCLAALFFLSFACGSGKDLQETAQTNITYADNSKISLDWAGVYKGTLPCADCAGIEITISLQSNNGFNLSSKYLGKEDNASIFKEGTFEWNEEGSKISLMDNGKIIHQYQVGENMLFFLDQEGQRITGNLADKYILTKNPTDVQLENKEWILFEIRGEKVTVQEDKKHPYIFLDLETSRYSGNGSCNNFFGNYELKQGSMISFGPAASTMMACLDLATERQFLDVLPLVDNYSIKDDTLSLNMSKAAPLAKFVLKK